MIELGATLLVCYALGLTAVVAIVGTVATGSDKAAKGVLVNKAAWNQWKKGGCLLSRGAHQE